MRTPEQTCHKSMTLDFILEKGSGKVNEDALLIHDNLFGVFDGATGLEKPKPCAQTTGGAIAANTAKEVFQKNSMPLDVLACEANRKIFEKMTSCNVDLSRRHKIWSTSAAVVRFKENFLEWVQTGDSFILLIYKDQTFKTLVEKNDHDFETLKLLKAESRNGSAAVARKLETPLRQTRSMMNRSYGVLNGEKEAEIFLNRGLEPLDNVAHVLLFTDGLQIPVRIPEKRKRFAPLVDLYLESGLDAVKNHIRDLESKDPVCSIYPRFKCHDDIAAISISLDRQQTV